ncbi:protein pitchfork-like isoform X2 [Hippoglossus hippoglossus]|uniref:protein pitchfork-like isoform X2 n=1 Tax=Hippoglossus hippoglossus TaxID=8267 RepID=UPI00148C4A0C|nr:protein pitchfork-like isoform X2 [Hippoglossus hippoglossus]
MSVARAQRSAAFCSSQERKLFPLHYAPDRLGNQMHRQGAPHLGPGCYVNHETVTPSPQQYQQDHSQSTIVPPGKSPFNSTTERFKPPARAAEGSPGPGTYKPDAVTNRKVSWPMCFGRPDWSRLPPLEKKSLRVKLHSEKALLKQRSRVAYLSLYF